MPLWLSETANLAGPLLAAAGFGAIVGGAVTYFLGLKDGRQETRLRLSKPARRIASR